MMMNLELEAARALTDLANPTDIAPPLHDDSLKESFSSVQLSGDEDHVNMVELYGEKNSNMMVRKLIQAEEDTELQLNSSSSKTCATYAGSTTIQDLNIVPEDLAVEGQQHSEKECNVMVRKLIQADEDTKFQPNHSCGKSSTPHVGCKPKRSLNLLTEDQKELRRLRRMLANRESARQTILRRQARCDELARKAADLECENDHLKKEKEVAMKEYESLKSTNESLKAQLIMDGVTVNVEVEETQEGSKFNSAHIPTSTSTSTQHLYVYNQPSTLPYVLPYITPGSNILQSTPQNGTVNTSQIPVIKNDKISSQSEHKNPVKMNVPGNSYALPYTWLFPLSYHANRVPPQSLDLANKHYVTNESSTSSYRKPVADGKKDQRFPLKMIRGEASTSKEIIGPTVQSYCGKVSGGKAAHKHKATSATATDSSSEENEGTVVGLRARPMDSIKQRDEFVTPATATSFSSEKNEYQTGGRQLWRQMDAFTAAAARKRRKEVIKMKNFHYSRQSHLKISSI